MLLVVSILLPTCSPWKSPLSQRRRAAMAGRLETPQAIANRLPRCLSSHTFCKFAERARLHFQWQQTCWTGTESVKMQGGAIQVLSPNDEEIAWLI
jgi:hypothetical protein